MKYFLVYCKLITELETKFNDDLNNEFNKNYFENKAEILKKEKELLYLEKDSDFSDSEYEFYVRSQMELMKDNNDVFDCIYCRVMIIMKILKIRLCSKWLSK